MSNAIHVFSEIGRLKQVMLHRPGRELENLVPDPLNRLLFDDIPFLEQARAEHDQFADVLRNNNVEVLYLEDLAAEALTSQEIKEQFIKEYLEETTSTICTASVRLSRASRMEPARMTWYPSREKSSVSPSRRTGSSSTSSNVAILIRLRSLVDLIVSDCRYYSRFFRRFPQKGWGWD